ncbi:mitochondrial import inner membrane translocase subunit TIM16 [Savitreella phatthalungensis]
MAHRIIAQVVIVGTQVFGKAFVQAWKQAAANSARVSADSGAGAGKDAITKSTGLTVEEACQILNVKKDSLTVADVLARHKTMFDNNDPAKGGSFYIQSKVLRAKERLEMELGANAGSGPDSVSPAATDSPRSTADRTDTSAT